MVMLKCGLEFSGKCAPMESMLGKLKIGNPVDLGNSNGLMEENTLENGRRGKNMVKEHALTMMEECMLGNGRMGRFMDKGKSNGLMETNKRGSGRRVKNMVKEQSLFLVEENG